MMTFASAGIWHTKESHLERVLQEWGLISIGVLCKTDILLFFDSLENCNKKDKIREGERKKWKNN